MRLHTRPEVLTAVKMLMVVFFVVTLPGLGLCRDEDEGSMFLQNVAVYPQVHTALQLRRPT
jgi:hypothetical protein